MKTYLEEAGFTNIRKTGIKDCSPVFEGKDNAQYEAFSLYVEAVKESCASIGKPNMFSRFKNLLKRLKLSLFEKDILLVSRSAHFDSAWYLHINTDVRLARVDPAEHYVRHGWREGREPSGLFDTEEYFKQFPDIKNTNTCPLVHYIKHGCRINAHNALPPQVIALIEPFDFKSVYDLGNKKTGDIPYAYFYRSRGIEYSSIDLNGLDGSIPLDLTAPLDLAPRDVVLNLGTSEHVNNQEAVFRNIHSLSAHRMIHWLPQAGCHPAHGQWGYGKEFFIKLAKLNSYHIEKLYLEETFKKWKIICCSLRKSEKTCRNFVWSESLVDKLSFSMHGSSGVDYS